MAAGYLHLLAAVCKHVHTGLKPVLQCECDKMIVNLYARVSGRKPHWQGASIHKQRKALKYVNRASKRRIDSCLANTLACAQA